jgi:hypothetical protein
MPRLHRASQPELVKNWRRLAALSERTRGYHPLPATDRIGYPSEGWQSLCGEPLCWLALISKAKRTKRCAVQKQDCWSISYSCCAVY